MVEGGGSVECGKERRSRKGQSFCRGIEMINTSESCQILPLGGREEYEIVF